MKKIAFIFPGQGAQYVGMGQDFYNSYPVCKEVYEMANTVTGLPITEICFTENEKINITEFTQIAMVTTEAAILSLLEQEGVNPFICAGLSLGEYGALLASKAVSQKDCFQLIVKRGSYMQNAYPTGGAMAAVIGMDATHISEICEQTEGIVSVANYNCPGQIVITGEETAVTKAGAALKEAGAKRVIPLTVSGPFHSKLLEGAGEKLAQDLKQAEFLDFTIPYITNVTAECVTSKDAIAELLQRQISSSVMWQQSVERMIEMGVDTFLEIGPGKTLSGFVKKINKECIVYNIDKVEDFHAFMEVFRQEA